MRNIIYHPNLIEQLEDKCIQIIKEQIDILFSGCFKSLKTYSVLVANDFKMHNKENFESMILSEQEIEFLIEKINRKVIEEIQSTINRNIEGNMKTKIDYDYIDNIGDFVDCLYLTDQLTKKCEKIINNNVCGIVGTITKNIAVGYLIDKIDFAEILLGDASSKKSTLSNQVKIFNKIEGILINIQNELYNQLIGQAIDLINKNIKNKINNVSQIA